MRWPISRTASPIALMGLLLTLGAALLASPAQAVPVQTGSLTMASDEGDYIGGGETYAYATSAGDLFSTHDLAVNDAVSIRITAANGDWWTLDFEAPEGERLAVGTYANATRYPFQEPTSPGLDVSGVGRGCNTLTGSFTVNEITYGPEGAVESFDADFEQHCEGVEPALRGHVRIVVGPPPPPLTLDLGLQSRATVNRAGRVTVRGTVTCNVPTRVTIAGTLTQRPKRSGGALGQLGVEVICSGTMRWTAVVESYGVAFGPGKARLEAVATAYDPVEGNQVSDSASATLRLAR